MLLACELPDSMSLTLITMFSNLAEPDWKKFKIIHQAALQRYSQSRLDALKKLVETQGQSPQERLVDAFDFARQTQKEMSRIFDDCRRSRAFMQLALMRSENLIEPEEWNTLSEGTRESIKLILREG